MNAPPESGPTTKLQRFKNDLTLELVLREGPFWKSVDAIRSDLKVRAELWTPSRDHKIVTDLRHFASEPYGDDAHFWEYVGYFDDGVQRLHDHHVPLHFRVSPNRVASETAWSPFFGQSILYDPHPLHLLDYAEAFTASIVGAELEVLESPPSGGDGGSNDPINRPVPYSVKMGIPQSWRESVKVGAELEVATSRTSGDGTDDPVDGPVAGRVRLGNPPFLREPVKDDILGWHEWKLAELSRLLAERLHPLDIDLRAMIDEILDEGLESEARKRLADLPPHYLIDVSPSTTQDEVRSAFLRIETLQPRPRIVGRPPNHPLEAAQCYFWQQEGWSRLQIARQLGREPRADSFDKKRRPNAIIDLLKDGKTLMAGRKYPDQ